MDETLAGVDSRPGGGLEVRVNFGVLAGRQATPAELEQLGRRLFDEVGDVAVVSEERLEVGPHSEAEVHQVRVELEPPLDEALVRRVVDVAEEWAQTCASERHIDVAGP